MNRLDEWGLGSFFEDAFAAEAEPGESIGRVLKSQGSAADVITDSGELRARVRPTKESLAVGDWVRVDTTASRVEARLPRRSQITRRRPGRAAREQVLCANVDVGFILTGLDEDFSVRRIERYLALVAASGAEPVLILTKVDLCDSAEDLQQQVMQIAGEVPVITTNAPAGEGVEEVRRHLPKGDTAVLLGSSGVGKSTLLNALIGDEVAATKSLMHDGRGRHTTTHRELFLLPDGGLVADVPGLREVGVVEAEGVTSAFEEVTDLAAQCRFSNCQHQREPGCAVEEALQSGTLEQDRFDSYLGLQREAKAHARRSNEHTRRKHEKAHPAIKLRKRRRKDE